MIQYQNLMQQILDWGVRKDDRTGTGTVSMFGAQMRFDLKKGFPLVTTKKCHLHSIVHELLWFLNGDTNTKYLNDNGVTIWDEWAVTEDVIDLQRTATKLIDANFRAITIVGLINEAEAEYGVDLETAMPAQVRDYVARYCARQARVDDLWYGGNSNKTVEDYIVYSKRKGDNGPIYGKQWRDWVDAEGRHHDQIAEAIRLLKTDPDNRRIIVSAWNVGDLDKMSLAPCHAFIQFYSRELSFEERVQWLSDNKPDVFSKMEAQLIGLRGDEAMRDALNAFSILSVPTRALSSQLYQRSVDTFLGLPFNIASYAILTHMIAYIANMDVEDFVWSGGDVHLYSNHLEQAKLQLSRQPKNLPKFVWRTDRKVNDPKEFTMDDFEIVGYDPHPAIKAPIAI